jgi:hypothetical protein
MAVAKTAKWIGINMQNTGSNRVPNPNPEKKVSKEAENETKQIRSQMNISSINCIFNENK